MIKQLIIQEEKFRQVEYKREEQFRNSLERQIQMSKFIS